VGDRRHHLRREAEPWPWYRLLIEESPSKVSMSQAYILKVLSEERLKIGGMILLGALFVLGCATSIAPVEPREIQPEEIATSGFESAAVVTDHPPLIAVPETRLSSFGSVTTDLPTDEIRNAQNEMYGWLIWVGSSPEPVEWVEKHSAPTGVDLVGGRRVDISEDGRTATYAGSMVPDQGFIHSQWILGADEAPGRRFLSMKAGPRSSRIHSDIGWMPAPR